MKTIGWALLFVACGSQPPATSANALPTSAASTPHATTLPAELAIVKGATMDAGPFAWPEHGSSAIVRDDSQSYVVWKVGERAGTLRLDGAAREAVLRDVTKDGKPELVIFAKPSAQPSEPSDDKPATWIIGMGPKSKPAHMWKLEAQLIGAHDEASFDAELAVKTLGPTTSPVKLIARLPLATPGELEALVGPTGVKQCVRQGEKRKCSPVPQPSVAKVKLASIAEFAPESGEFDLQIPDCHPDEKNAKNIVCESSIGGPEGSRWVFEKTSGRPRLAEVWTWAEDS